MNRSGGKTGFPAPVNRYFLFMALQRFVNPFVLAKAPNANVCSGSYLTLTSIFACSTRLWILNLIKFHLRDVCFINFSISLQASRLVNIR